MAPHGSTGQADVALDPAEPIDSATLGNFDVCVREDLVLGDVADESAALGNPHRKQILCVSDVRTLGEAIGLVATETVDLLAGT